MGSLLGVAQGSSNPPFLIVLKYQPATTTGTDHLALVGKGVTFDTGGLSIKPSDGMEKMKYDMAGAAAVIGAMRALAQLKPSIPVTGYIPTVENMINGLSLIHIWIIWRTQRNVFEGPRRRHPLTPFDGFLQFVCEVGIHRFLHAGDFLLLGFVGVNPQLPTHSHR